MEITIAYLLIVVFVIVTALIVLIIFEGRTNHKVKHLKTDIEIIKNKLEISQPLLPDSPTIAEEKKAKPKIEHITPEAEKKVEQPPSMVHSTPEAEKKAEPPLHSKKMIDRPVPVSLIALMRQQIKPTEINFEKLIGRNAFALIGVSIFILGLTFFVKYALEQAWFNVTGRIIGGLVGSLALIAIAHTLRNRHRAYSSVLVGGGLALQYFIFSLAFNEYHLFSQTTGIVILLFIIAITILISIAYNRVELAILAFLAGVTAPFIAKFDLNNWFVLFSYLLIIDIGVLILSYFKKWVSIYLISYVFTGLFYLLWILKVRHDELSPIAYLGVLCFLTLFYIAFLSISMIYNLKVRKPFHPTELSLIISINLLYYASGYALLAKINQDYTGVYTAMLALTNLFLLVIVYRSRRADFGLISLLFGLFLIFSFLIPPIELIEKSLTLVWSLQIILLLWLSQRIQFKMMKLGSLFMTLVMLISLGMDMWDTYVEATTLAKPLTPFLNVGFITNIIAAIALGFNGYLLRREPDKFYLPLIPVKAYRVANFGIMLIIIYLSGYLEIKYQIIQSATFEPSIRLMMGIYHVCFLSLPIIPLALSKKRQLNWLGLVLSGIVFILYLAFLHDNAIAVRNAYLFNAGAQLSHFLWHIVILSFLVINAVVSIITISRLIPPNWLNKVLTGVSIAVILFILSTELDHISVILNYNKGLMPGKIVAQNHLLPFTILWATVSFIIMWIGMKINNMSLRVCSITLFTITLLKLLIFDMSRITENARIIAFVVVGLLLLLVSYMYYTNRKLHI